MTVIDFFLIYGAGVLLGVALTLTWYYAFARKSHVREIAKRIGQTHDSWALAWEKNRLETQARILGNTQKISDGKN